MPFSKFKKLVQLHEELLRRGKKLCTRCLEIKTLKEFYKDKGAGTIGLRPMCHICELEYYHKKSRKYRARLGLKNNPFRTIKT